MITGVDDDEQRVSVAMTKEQIKSAPDFEAGARDDRDQTYDGSLRR